MGRDERLDATRGGRGEQQPTQNALYGRAASAAHAAQPGPGEPVECLGRTFESEEVRRSHFRARLKAGIEELHDRLGGVPWEGVDEAVARLAAIRHWPMGAESQLRSLAERMRSAADRSKDLLQRWKDETGFPQGEIEDILNLSDPPWHTACPNPFLGEFVAAYGKPYDPEAPYRRKPFAVDVKEGKGHAIYRAHSYHTKVPHLAIIPSILHYTEPGDLVLDGFAGSGMTGVAAQWCGTAPQRYRQELEARWAQADMGKPAWGARRAILNDLSPLASFIAANYTLPFDVDEFAEAGRRLLDDVDAEVGWMYETLHTDGKTKGRIDYTVWSEVFGCRNCSHDVLFTEAQQDEARQLVCPNCGSTQRKEKMDLRLETYMDPADGQIRQRPRRDPVLIFYQAAGIKHHKQPDVADLQMVTRLAMMLPPSRLPVDDLPECQMTRVGRMTTTRMTSVRNLFLPRAAYALAALWKQATRASHDVRVQQMLLYFVQQAIWNLAVVNTYRPTGYSQNSQWLKGVYYVPSQHAECSPWYVLSGKLDRLHKTFGASHSQDQDACRPCGTTATGTATHISLPDDSVDYIFTDPPFGENIYYADLNFLIESWHGVVTNVAPEAIVDRVRGKKLATYQRLMQRAFEEYCRVLKPGRWITVVFHNSSSAVWTAIQEALLAAGFVVADVRTMDKRQGSFKQVTSTAVKQDLIISAYKPNDGLEGRFALSRGTEEGVWDFLRTHLAQLPVFVAKEGQAEVVHERQPHVLFDRMVAFHVLRGVTVPLSVGAFLAGVSQRYPERDGMVFLPDQVVEYDRKSLAAGNAAQLEIFVRDEASAIQWLRQRLRAKPQSFQDLHPHFLRELLVQSKHEKLPELSEMLEQNFLLHDGSGNVPSQIHAYLSTNFKELRNRSKNDPALQAKATGRWYVPDPNKAADVEKRRTGILLREFDEIRASTQHRLKLFRLEAVRAGFFRAYQERDYDTIIQVAERLPPSVLQEDQKLILWYDQAVTRKGAAS